VLSAAHRLRSSKAFSEVVRGGRRAGRPLLTVHLDRAGTGTTAGLVVSKAVGSSVVRHRVARRLRHLLASRLPQLPEGTRLVVRAAPAAAQASSAELAGDLDRALSRALDRDVDRDMDRDLPAGTGQRARS
jgi:ribonuclease P protein component